MPVELFLLLESLKLAGYTCPACIYLHCLAWYFACSKRTTKHLLNKFENNIFQQLKLFSVNLGKFSEKNNKDTHL